VLRELADVITEPISNIFERSCGTGEVSEDWRKAKVTPVFKKGEKKDPGIYRPVSLTSIPGKVMEQLILDVIIKQVEEKKVIRSSQHGCTKGKSCLTNLIAFYDGTTSWVGEERAVDVAYLDFSKAFDAFAYEILILYGVGRDLCRSYSPTPLPKQGHLQQAAQDHIYVGFEYLQIRRLHNLSGQPVPVLHHPQSKQVLLHVQLELLMLFLCLLPVVLSLSTTEKSLAPSS